MNTADNSYAELELSLHLRSGESYAVEMRYTEPGSDAEVRLSRDAGEATATLEFDRLRELLLDHKLYGWTLSNALFASAEVRQKFGEARAAASRAGLPLRIRIYIGPTAPKLHALRWETLADPDVLAHVPREETCAATTVEAELNGKPVCVDLKKIAPLITGERVYFSRYLNSADWRPVPMQRKAALRALVVAANPRGLEAKKLAEVQVEAEIARAKSALKGIDDIGELASGRGETVTLNDIVKRVSPQSGHTPDILYLVAHGVLRKGEPYLLLENESCEVEEVPGEDLVTRLRELQVRPRLVVLASCQSAGTGTDGASTDKGILAALGPRLAEAGVAAVVAMQGNISMRTVELFMPVFFRELQAHGQIDRAIAKARGMVREEDDWWAPTLFMRLRSGRIWYEPGFTGDQSEMEQWPAIMMAIEDRQCTPIVGPGAYDSILGSRQELARKWAEDLKFPLAPEAMEDLPQVTQYLSVQQGKAYVQSFLRKNLKDEILRKFAGRLPQDAQDLPIDELISAAGQAAEQDKTGPGRQSEPSAYRVIARVPAKVFVTANPGDLLADALRAEGRDPRVEICQWKELPRDRPSGSGDGEASAAGTTDGLAFQPTVKQPLVYHLFGHVTKPDSMVLTEDDYFHWLIGVTANKERIPLAVRKALASTALLFVGFRIDEWDFRAILRYIMTLMGRAAGSDYSSVAAQISLQEGRNLEPRRAQRYLETYFQKQSINIYWGSADDFARELAEQLRSAGMSPTG